MISQILNKSDIQPDRINKLLHKKVSHEVQFIYPNTPKALKKHNAYLTSVAYFQESNTVKCVF